MTEYLRSRPRDWHERAYRLLLHAYPGRFRQEFGDAMLEFFRDRLSGARKSHGPLGVAEVWSAALLDVVREATFAWLDSVRRAPRTLRDLLVRQRGHAALHDSHRRDWMWSSILQDVRYSLRGTARSPAFSIVVVLTLALGIGANAAIFSVVRGVLLKPLPFQQADRLVRVQHVEPYQTVSEPEFADYRREATAFAGMAASAGVSASITGKGEEAERVEVARVSDRFFDVLRAPARLGRTFTPDEEKPGAPSVVILSDGFWRRRYGADSSIVGREIVINGTARSVVGVMPPRFEYPSASVSIWTPLRLNYDSLWTRNNHYLSVFGRLAPNAEIARAQTELAVLARRFMKDFPEIYSGDTPLRVNVIPLDDSVVGRARPYLYALFGAVAFVLMIACVNVAGLLLARGEARRKELAIRAAMGASRVRIIRQVLTESLLHAAAGGALGVAIAWWGVRLLRAFAPADLPRVGDVSVDGVVLLFTSLVVIATGLAFGVVPALRISRDDTAETLKEGGKTSSAAARGLGKARQRLVVAEVALAVVTLTGAGLMLRSLWNLQAINLGFSRENVMTLQVAPPATEYQGDRSTQFYQSVLERVLTVPGVTSAAAVSHLPVADGHNIWSILLDGAPMTSIAQAPSAMPQVVTPGYFETMRIPLLRGRAIADADDANAPMVVLVNESMVRKYWPNSDPLGRTIRMYSGGAPWATVVGVVRDVRSTGFLGVIPPTMYFPHAQAGKSAYFTPTLMNLVVRTQGDPSLVVGPLRVIVRDIEPNAPLSRVQTMEQLVAESVETRAFATELLAGFALLALILAGIGIYTVVSYSMSQRRYEIGLRLALGARRGQVVGLVVSEGVRTALAGAVLGLAGSVAVTRAVRATFVDVSAWDPLTLVSVVAALIAVATLASYLPARRASAVDPMAALRAE